MVKFLLLVWLTCNIAFAQDIADTTNALTREDPLTTKIKSF